MERIINMCVVWQAGVSAPEFFNLFQLELNLRVFFLRTPVLNAQLQEAISLINIVELPGIFHTPHGNRFHHVEAQANENYRLFFWAEKRNVEMKAPMKIYPIKLQ